MVLNLHRIARSQKELKELYLNLAIESFAFSLIGIFIPIYLLKLGYGLNLVLLFMLVNLCTIGALSPITAHIASRTGLKHAILFRMPLLMLFFFLLNSLDKIDGPFLMFIAFIGGLAESLYWVSLNSEFVKNSDSIHEGEEIGQMIAFPRLATIFAPLIGGYIAVAMGFDMLFIIVMVILAVAVMPLFLTTDYKSYFRFRIKETRLFLNHRLSLQYFLWGAIAIAEAVMWPLYIYLKFDDLVLIGLTQTIAGIAITLLTFYMGRIADKTDRRKMLRYGAITYAMVWFARLFATSVTEIILLSFLGGLFATRIIIVVFAQFCNFARGKHILRNVVFWELWLMLGKLFAFILIILAVSKFEVAFIMAGILTLFYLFV